MSITIENPTAEAVWQAIQQLPQNEVARLKELFDNSSQPVQIDESTEWSGEDIEDFKRSTQRLIEKRLGPEEHDYD